MASIAKVLEKVLRGTADNNIQFDEIRRLLKRLRFQVRLKGSHHIFVRIDVEEILNLQPVGKMAKAYQVKQVRNVILKYGLADELTDPT